MYIKEREAKIVDFCEQTGLTRDRYREQQFSFKMENGVIASWGKSVSSKAVIANKKALTRKREDAIIKEIKACGIKGDVHLTPTKINVSELSFDDKHINKENKRSITRKQAQSFIKNASISVTTWNGSSEKYFSYGGAAYVLLEENSIRTAYTKDDFDEIITNMMEVLKKYGY